MRRHYFQQSVSTVVTCLIIYQAKPVLSMWGLLVHIASGPKRPKCILRNDQPEIHNSRTIHFLHHICNFVIAGSSVELELSDSRLVLLCDEINQPRKLRKLAVVGLNMDTKTIDSALQNYRGDIIEAAYSVLQQWRDSQPNRTIAYEQICQALRDVKMDMLITETLK